MTANTCCDAKTTNSDSFLNGSLGIKNSKEKCKAKMVRLFKLIRETGRWAVNRCLTSPNKTPLCEQTQWNLYPCRVFGKKSLGWPNSHWVGLVFDYVFVIGLFLKGLLVYSIKTWPIVENAGFSIAFPLSAFKVATL